MSYFTDSKLFWAVSDQTMLTCSNDLNDSTTEALLGIHLELMKCPKKSCMLWKLDGAGDFITSFRLSSHCRTEWLTAEVWCIPVHHYRSDFCQNFRLNLNLKWTRKCTGLLCNLLHSWPGNVWTGSSERRSQSSDMQNGCGETPQ